MALGPPTHTLMYIFICWHSPQVTLLFFVSCLMTSWHWKIVLDLKKKELRGLGVGWHSEEIYLLSLMLPLSMHLMQCPLDSKSFWLRGCFLFFPEYCLRHNLQPPDPESSRSHLCTTCAFPMSLESSDRAWRFSVITWSKLKLFGMTT